LHRPLRMLLNIYIIYLAVIPYDGYLECPLRIHIISWPDNILLVTMYINYLFMLV